MLGITDLAHARRFLADRGLATILLALACQGFTLTINGVGAPWIMRSYGLDQPAMARAFAWISLSALGAFLLARQADRVGRRRILVWAMTIGAVASMGAAWSRSLALFIVLDMIVVATAGGAVTCGVVWLAEASSSEDRATGQALAGLAIVLGSGPCVLLMPWLVRTDLSWRMLFLLSSAAVVVVPFLPRALAGPQGHHEGSTGSMTRFDRAHRSQAIALVGTTVLSTIATATMEAWRYLHMVADVGLTPAAASGLALGGGILGIAGFPLGTLASNRFGRVPTAAGFLILMTSAIGWSFLGPPPSGAHPWLWLGVGFSVTALAGNATTVAANTAINELFPAHFRATMFGWLNLAASIGRVVAQALVAVAAARLGGVSTAVGAMALTGPPAAALLLWFVPETLRPAPAAHQSPDNPSTPPTPPGPPGPPAPAVP